MAAKSFSERVYDCFRTDWVGMVGRAKAILAKYTNPDEMEEGLADQDEWYDIYPDAVKNADDAADYFGGAYHDDPIVRHLEESVWLAAAATLPAKSTRWWPKSRGRQSRGCRPVGGVQCDTTFARTATH